MARPAEEVMSPEPGAASGKGGQHYTTDCPIARIGSGHESVREIHARSVSEGSHFFLAP